jgi:anti-sigma regulatory factor (Ser/Thr protein kinase)
MSFLSHDMIAPLHNVAATLHLLQIEGPQMEGRHELISAALKGCESVYKLVRELIEYNKLTSTRRGGGVGSASDSLHLESVSIRDLLTDVVSGFKPTANVKGLKFIFEPPPQELYWMCDVSTMQRALVNLVSNAVKYTESGSIGIRASVEQEYDNLNRRMCSVEIWDTGIGMTPEEIKQLYRPYTRFTDNSNSSGLGLFNAKLFIDQNHGTIDVTSAKQTGTTFKVRLPLAQPVEQVANGSYDKEPIAELDDRIIISSIDELTQKLSDKFDAPTRPPKEGNRTSVLLVDDDRDFLASVSRGLRLIGFEVSTSSSVNEAKRLLRENCFDSVVSDYSMPECRGDAFLSNINQRARSVEEPFY